MRSFSQKIVEIRKHDPYPLVYWEDFLGHEDCEKEFTQPHRQSIYEHLSYLLRRERRNDENHEWARDSSRHENARTQIWWQLKITWCILHILIVSAILIIFILLICLLLLYSCTPPLLRSSFATVKIFFKLLSHEGYFIFLQIHLAYFF